MSSESAAATIEAYTFRQLEAPVGGSVHDAADVLSAAHAEAEQIREQARAAGEAEGRAAGLAAVRAEMQPALESLSAAADELRAVRDQLLSELQSDAVNLALRMTEHILGGAVQVAPERVVDVAGLALRRISERRTVTLVVNPADLDLLAQAVPALRSELGGIEHLNVQSDRRVGRGGVLARTEAGEIDASIDTQLQRVREIAAAELAPADGDDDR